MSYGHHVMLGVVMFRAREIGIHCITIVALSLLR